MKNFKLLLLIPAIYFFSCGEMETVIDLEIPAHDPVLVLNGRLDTDTNIQVLISKSVGAFETASPSMINDAEVLLFENGTFINSLELDTHNTIYPWVNDGNWNTSTIIAMNYYKTNVIPKENNNYRIEVNHDNYNSVSATTYIPEDIILYNISIDSTSNTDKINFQFSFDDNIDQDNFYSLSLIASCNKVWEDDYGYDEEYDWEYRVEMNSNDPSFPVNELFSGYTFSGDKAIFTDALFNGQQKNISIDVFTDDFKYSDCDTIKFEFSTFSDDAYKYYSSLSEQREKGDLDIFGGEVVPVYTNVTNGLGILISKNAQEIYIKP
jgi:hypothetical protein